MRLSCPKQGSRLGRTSGGCSKSLNSCHVIGPNTDNDLSSDRDLLMLMNLNGRERTREAFEAIFASVTPKLRLQKVHRPEAGELSLIEATLASVHWDEHGTDHIKAAVNGHANGTHAVNGGSVAT
jgi:hypothetical protein